MKDLTEGREFPTLAALHKYKVNHQILADFFFCEKVAEHHINEIYKVINIVMIKHFCNYWNIFEDLKSFALVALLERKRDKVYNIQYSAYSYMYTIVRNEIGNNIRKLKKENIIEDSTSYKIKSIELEVEDLPIELRRHYEILTGLKKFNVYRIPKKDVIPLLVFMRLYGKDKKYTTPEFIIKNKHSVDVLYNILTNIIETIWVD